MRKTPWSVLRSIARGRRVLNAFAPDIVHSHGFHGNLFARVMGALGVCPKPISTIHNVFEGGRARMLVYRFTDRFATLTTAVSAAAAERFVRLRAVRAEKCRVVPNGFDTRESVPNAERRARMRCESGAGNEFVWLAAGRIVPAKDYPNLLNAFALVRLANQNCLLWIAGAGEPEQEARMRGLAAELEIASHVQWLGLCRDMPALFDAADGFVLASAWEGMPMVLGEAMATEKPIAATDVGGVRELLGDSGMIVSANNAGALAQAMRAVMEMQAEERRELGRFARRRIEDSFSLDAIADGWEEIYREVAARNG
jgi:glycosyltransferase involved in cell wall biosynthesis